MFLGNTSWRSKVIAPWLIDAAGGVKSARVNAGEVTRNVLEAALWHKARETCSQEGKGLVYPGWYLKKNAERFIRCRVCLRV